jgi:hypothetical protein
MEKLFFAFWLSFAAMALPLFGCADEVNAKTDDITTDNDDDDDDVVQEGTAGNPADEDPDVAECVAACDDDSCAAACRE